MEEIGKVNSSEGSINLAQPDGGISLEDQNVELAEILYEPDIFNRKKLFFKPAPKEDSEGAPHELICCQRNVVSVFSISASQGIKIRSKLPLPEFSGVGSQKTSMRLFFHNFELNKVFVMTSQPAEFGYNQNFLEIDLDLKRGLTANRLFSKPIKAEDVDITDKAVILSSLSPRIYVRNCLFWVDGVSIAQSYLTRSRRLHSRPNLLFRRENQNLRQIFYSEVAKISQEEIGGFGNFYYFDEWPPAPPTPQNWSDLMDDHCKIKIRHLNRRLYSAEFFLFGFLKVVKIYEKQTARVLKVMSIVPAKILYEGLKVESLLEEHQLNARVSSEFDLAQDKLAFSGTFKRVLNSANKVAEFELTAHNCLLKKNKRRFEVEYLEPSRQRYKQCCFGEYEYLVSQEDDSQETPAVTVVSLRRKGGVSSSEKGTKTISLDKKTPLLDKFSGVSDLGVFGGQNLVYLTDRRHLYLFDIALNRVTQRARYSSFSKVLPYPKSSKYSKNQSESKVYSTMVSKVDIVDMKLEFFQIREKSIEPLQDFDLRRAIEKTLKRHDGLVLDRIEAVRIGEGRGILLSILSQVLVGSISEDFGRLGGSSSYFCLINLKKDSLERQFERQSSVVFPRSDLGEENPEQSSLTLMDEWRFDPQENRWHFLDFQNVKKNDANIFRFLLTKKKMRILDGEEKKINICHAWIGEGAELNQETIKIEEQLGDPVCSYFSVCSLRIFEDRLFVEHSAGPPSFGDDSNELTVYERSRLVRVAGVGFRYTKIGSVRLGKELFSFVGGGENLRVIVARSTENGDQKSVISIADRDLVIIHRFALSQLCGGLRASALVVSALPCLLADKWIVLSFYNRGMGFRSPGYAFLLDLGDFTLKRVIRGNRETGLPESKLLPKNDHEGAENVLNNSLAIFGGGSNFLLVDNSVYTLGE